MKYIKKICIIYQERIGELFMDKAIWNLTDIYKDEDRFLNDKKQIQEKLTQIKLYKGKLGECANNLYECYNLYEQLLELYEKFYAYGMLSYHLDMSDNNNIKLFKTVENIGTQFEKETSFITPEVMKMDNETISDYIANDTRLKRYKRLFDEIIENKEHILSEEEEELLANYSEVFSSMENTYDILTNTEFIFGKLINEKGEEVELTNGNYTFYLKSKNTDVRKTAFDLMYKKYSEFSKTICELYLTKVKTSTINSKLRKYNSSLEKTVKHDDSTIKVYNTLIEAVHKNLFVNHEFMKIKKDLIKKDEIHLYDIYVNPLEEDEDYISFEDAKKQVIDALSVLGNEYIEKLKFAFDNNWIDVYKKKNKMSGAYSMGVYGVHPFVLDNFINKKRDVSTIAHELGHAMHSYYSNTNQNVIDANYTIAVAEIASTVNEILLAKYLIDKEKDIKKKKEVIYELVETIRATLFRQTMFAEFEKDVHQRIENNEVLTCDDLNKIYYDLNKKYFGENIIVDEQIKYEWLRIPHFYTPFYVYKYATGISAAIIIAKNILDKKKGYKEKYIEMLKQGCTKKAVPLLKMVDVDLEDSRTYENAILWMKDLYEKL